LDVSREVRRQGGRLVCVGFRPDDRSLLARYGFIEGPEFRVMEDEAEAREFLAADQ
jgi:hypothetical protein